MSYTILTSQVRPYSITTLREHTRVSTNDFDSELRRSWYAATSDIEKRAGILLRQCTVRGDLLGSPDGYVFPVGPVTNLAGITMTNQETGAVLTQGRTGDYIVDMTNQNPTIRVMNRSSFSNRNVPFSIEFDAGYDSQNILDDIEIAALELAAHHFENRESTSPFQVYTVPSSVWSILASYGTAKI
jgi:uncharacterized phiE125 gp8 family phage protein